MGRNTDIIPRAPCARILERNGAKRVSAGAMDALADYLTDEAMRISSLAIEISKHAKRKTVTDGDIRLAAKR